MVTMITTNRVIAIVMGVAVVVSFLTGYGFAKNRCEAQAQRALEESLETAKKSGKIDKELAEQAVTTYSKREESLNESIEKAKESVDQRPDSKCVVGDDELQYLNSV